MALIDAGRVLNIREKHPLTGCIRRAACRLIKISLQLFGTVVLIDAGHVLNLREKHPFTGCYCRAACTAD